MELHVGAVHAFGHHVGVVHAFELLVRAICVPDTLVEVAGVKKVHGDSGDSHREGCRGFLDRLLCLLHPQVLSLMWGLVLLPVLPV